MSTSSKTEQLVRVRMTGWTIGPPVRVSVNEVKNCLIATLARHGTYV